MLLKIFAFLFVIAAWCTNTYAQISVQGKIADYDGKSVVAYHEVIEGIFTPYWKNIKPSKSGVFTITFENEGYGSMRILYKGMTFRFFHDANAQIKFEIQEVAAINTKRVIPSEELFSRPDAIKQASLLKISGDYEVINQFYNDNVRSSYHSTRSLNEDYYSQLIYHASTPFSALLILDSLKQIELNQINQLPRTINIEHNDIEQKEKEVRNFLTTEVNAFYGAIFLKGMFLKRKEQISALKKDSTVERNIYNRDWEVLVEKLNEQAKVNLLPMTSSPDYLDFMVSMSYALSEYKKYHSLESHGTTLDDQVTNWLFKYDTTRFQDNKSIFANQLAGLQFYLNAPLYHSPTLLYAIYDLQAKHPNSKHFDFYKKQIQLLKTNLEKSQQEFSAAKIIRAKYESFEKLIARFAGKNVLVDIWATWCHPCIQEFKHKPFLETLIENDEIEVLYISIDRPEWKNRWKQSIKINELKGNHFRADKLFIEDMWNVIGDIKGSIPRYVLIDKKGQIFKSTAARPGDGNKLVSQIKLLNQ
jgi:thiol-disulfide isomerase/thioredoxin